jgi:aminoglycoside phosphotransferase (APT) family kinase protein
VTWPIAEFQIDELVVARILRAQHPDLGGGDLTFVGEGFDNSLWRLGSEHLVRLPRHRVAVELLRRELRWVPELADRITLPIPSPVRVGEPSPTFDAPWSIVPWFEGEPCDVSPITRVVDASRRLGGFLREMHQPAPIAAPTSEVRGVPLARRQASFDDQLAKAAHLVDHEATRAVWAQGLTATPWSSDPLWLHGDVHPGNILLVDGTISAVIDFGDLCAGDPASDLASAWLVLPEAGFSAFKESYGQLDRMLERRALAWAVLFGLLFINLGAGGREGYEEIGHNALRRAIRHSRSLDGR